MHRLFKEELTSLLVWSGFRSKLKQYGLQQVQAVLLFQYQDYFQTTTIVYYFVVLSISPWVASSVVSFTSIVCCFFHLQGGLRRPPKPAEVMPYFCLRLPAPLLHTTKGDGEIRLLLSLFFYYIFSSEKFSFAQDGSSTAGGTSNSGVSLDCSFCVFATASKWEERPAPNYYCYCLCLLA